MLKGVKKPKAPKSSKRGNESVEMETVELTLSPLEMTLDIADGSGEIDEVALQAVAEEYVLAALKSALPSANVNSVIVTITAVTSRLRGKIRRLAIMNYIIVITVVYEQIIEGEDTTSVEEALREQAFAAFKDDAFVDAVQADESIGATVTGIIVVVAPTPAPTAPVTPSPTNTPTLSPTAVPSTKPTVSPTSEPTISPFMLPPTNAPTFKPSDKYTHTPTLNLHIHTHTPTLDTHTQKPFTPPTKTCSCLLGIPCTNVPIGLVSCRILYQQVEDPCLAGSHCYGFPSTTPK